MVKFQTYYPSKLNGIIKSFWRLEISGEHTYKESIFPDGHHEILFHLNPDQAKRTILNGQQITEPKSFIAGQNLSSYSLKLKSSSIIYGIRFYPHTLAPLLSLSAEEMTDILVDLEDTNLAKKLNACVFESANQTFFNFENALHILTYNIDFSHTRIKVVERSIKKILASNGNYRIDALIKESGFSTKYFDTIFKQYVGLTPKYFAKIIKLNHFISIKEANPDKSLTECCYEANFFDQAHLIHSFRKITGNSPSAYLNNAPQISNIFSKL